MFNAFPNYNSPYINPVSTAGYTYGQPQKQEIVRVSGENGARSYRMPPNSSALLLDETQPVIWLAQTDGAGYPTLSAYKIEPFRPEQATASDLEKRIKRLEDIIDESNTINVTELKSKQSTFTD